MAFAVVAGLAGGSMRVLRVLPAAAGTQQVQLQRPPQQGGQGRLQPGLHLSIPDPPTPSPAQSHRLDILLLVQIRVAEGRHERGLSPHFASTCDALPVPRVGREARELLCNGGKELVEPRALLRVVDRIDCADKNGGASVSSKPGRTHPWSAAGEAQSCSSSSTRLLQRCTACRTQGVRQHLDLPRAWASASAVLPASVIVATHAAAALATPGSRQWMVAQPW